MKILLSPRMFLLDLCSTLQCGFPKLWRFVANGGPYQKAAPTPPSASSSARKDSGCDAPISAKV